MAKIISILTFGPEIEVKQVLESLPDLGEEVLSRVKITTLATQPAFSDKPLQEIRRIMFETSDESTADNSAFVQSQMFKLLVSKLHLGQICSFQPVEIDDLK